MPTSSLKKTYAALVIATVAVLGIAGFAFRDLVVDVDARCPGRFDVRDASLYVRGSNAPLDDVYLDHVTTTEAGVPSEPSSGPHFRLVFDPTRYAAELRGARLEWQTARGDVDCTCGGVDVALSGERPSDITLFRVHGTNEYVVKGRAGGYADLDNANIRAAFRIDPGSSHHLQLDRILSRRHLPLAVSLLALGALGIGLLRARRAQTYALRMHAWTEARVTWEGLIESDSGETLGALEQTRLRHIMPGPVLVSTDALASSGMYRDVPVIARRHVAEGSHARWAAATTRRLSDARVLSVISTGASLLALGARFLA